MKSKDEKNAPRLNKAQRQVDDYSAQFEGPLMPLTLETAKDAGYRTSAIGRRHSVADGMETVSREQPAVELTWIAMTPEQRKAHHHATMNIGQGGG